MYDIYFDLNDMHQPVEEDDKEYWLIGQSFYINELDDDMGVPDLDMGDDYIVVKRRPPNGYQCNKCNELFPHAEANQPDGSFTCYSCRNYR